MSADAGWKAPSRSSSPSCPAGGARWPTQDRTIPLLDTAIRLIDVPPDRVTITDPAHPLYGRQFDLIPATGPTTARALARVAYSATVVLKIPIAATSLH